MRNFAFKRARKSEYLEIATINTSKCITDSLVTYVTLEISAVPFVLFHMLSLCYFLVWRRRSYNKS